jgi:hypothetical protein
MAGKLPELSRTSHLEYSLESCLWIYRSITQTEMKVRHRLSLVGGKLLILAEECANSRHTEHPQRLKIL